jgi:hypothetical protein
VTLPQACSGFQAHLYSARQGLVACVAERDLDPTKIGQIRAVAIEVVRTQDLSVVSLPIAPTNASGLTIDEGSGEVVLESATDKFDSKTDSCVALSAATRASRPCKGPPSRPPRLVPRTDVAYGVSSGYVNYAQ